MNIGISTVLLLISALIFTGFNTQEKQETRDVGKFDKIGLGVAADLYLKQGSTTKLTIEAKEEILEKLKTEVKNGKLSIRFDSWRFSNYSKFKIYITTPEVNGLSISGSGDIIAESNIKTDEISLKISGSGEINIESLEAHMVDAGISGSGSIYLGGPDLKNMELAISGSGNLNAVKLPTEKFNGRISGSGSCKVHVNSSLNARISGSGKIYYAGNPLIDASSSGSGRVTPLK